MTAAIEQRMSLEQFLSYDDGTDRRYELVDGVLVEMGAESRANIKIALFLIQAFLQLVDYDRLGIKEKIEVESRYVTARDPDLVVHSEDSALAISGRSEACLKRYDPNPLVVIEVVSPGDKSSDNYKRDYEQKPAEYGSRGIAEYWIIDPERAVVRVGCLIEGTYDYTEFQNDNVIVSPAFPNWSLTAAEVLSSGQ